MLPIRNVYEADYSPLSFEHMQATEKECIHGTVQKSAKK